MFLFLAEVFSISFKNGLTMVFRALLHVEKNSLLEELDFAQLSTFQDFPNSLISRFMVKLCK